MPEGLGVPDTFCAPGITAYLGNVDTLEHAQSMTAHGVGVSAAGGIIFTLLAR